ncbi:hypothetical protein AFK68_00460, partial [Hydrocoleum sp. CS-953]|uniref:XRE family transcriptional regulator n=1 Tax=Hydrocoleum sp. CS-953 TaxID=1671698 RepID=UPI000BC4A17A
MTRPKKFKKVGAAFKELYESKGFKSAYELSKESGLRKDYISKVVNGYVGNPGPEKIKQIAEAFAKKSGLSVDDEIAELTKLFANDGNSFNEEEQQRSLSENTPKNEAQVVQEKKSQLSDFVGRETAIAELENWQKKGAKIIAIYGLGGIGKTTLAEKYFERQKFDIFRLQIGSESQDIPSVEQWVKYLLKNKFQEEPDADFSMMLEQFKTKLKIL